MTRLNSQRGVSLMLLILAITAFAGVAIGVVTLLRARYESYPYQVQSYQALTLANAGVEFAARLALDNVGTNGDYKTFMVANFTTPLTFSFGNGTFQLTYASGATGCGDDALYSRGKFGTATREIQIPSFGGLISRGGGGLATGLLLSVAPSARHYDYSSTNPTYNPDPTNAMPLGTNYSGTVIEFTVCDASLYNMVTNAYGAINGAAYDVYSNYGYHGTVAATLDGAGKPVTLARVGVTAWGTQYYIWDATCNSGSVVLCNTAVATAGTYQTCTPQTVQTWNLSFGGNSGYVYPGQVLPAWDGVTYIQDPHDLLWQTASLIPNQYMPILPVSSGYAYSTWPASGAYWAPPPYGAAATNRPHNPCNATIGSCDGRDFWAGCPGYPYPCCWQYSGHANPPNPTPTPVCYDYDGITPVPQGYDTNTTSCGSNINCTRTYFTCSTYNMLPVGYAIMKPGIPGRGGTSVIRLETFGDITPPVTFFVRLPYRPADPVQCSPATTSGLCRPGMNTAYSTFKFTVTSVTP